MAANHTRAGCTAGSAFQTDSFALSHYSTRPGGFSKSVTFPELYHFPPFLRSMILKSRGWCQNNAPEDSDLLFLLLSRGHCVTAVNMANPQTHQSGSSFGSMPSQQDAQDDTSKRKTLFFGFVKKTWQKTGLDRPTILLMMKWVQDQACNMPQLKSLTATIGAVFHQL